MSYELESSYFLPRKSASICVATSTAGGFDTDASELSSTAAGGCPIQSPTDHQECPVCSKSFSSTSTLNRHWRDFHTDRSKVNPCASFDDDSTKILRYDDALGPLSVCDSAMSTTTTNCNVSTSGQLVGVGRQQSGSQSNRQCSTCSKMFSSTSCMNRHRRVFHGDRSRAKVTDSSSPTTANGSSSLNGFCDRRCNVCLKMFSSSSTLNRHRREIHGDHSDKKKMQQLEKTFRCSECHRSLGSRESFVRHLATNHPQINLDKQELMFRSDVEFDVWKFKMETDGESKFVRSDEASRIVKTINIKDSDAGGADVINYYNCQYSIYGRDHPHNYRRRKLFHGSPDSESGSGSGSGSESKNASKLHFFCPAHIITRTNRICNSPVSVSFLATHLGHHQRLVQTSEKRLLRRPKSMSDCLEVDRHDLVKPEPLQFRDEFKARKKRLFDELNGLFLVIDECATQTEFDAFDGLLKLVRPVLTTIRTSTPSLSSPSDDFAAGLPQFSKQVLDTLSPLIGLARTTTSMDRKEENGRHRPVVEVRTMQTSPTQLSGRHTSAS